MVASDSLILHTTFYCLIYYICIVDAYTNGHVILQTLSDLTGFLVFAHRDVSVGHLWSEAIVCTPKHSYHKVKGQQRIYSTHFSHLNLKWTHTYSLKWNSIVEACLIHFTKIKWMFKFKSTHQFFENLSFPTDLEPTM